MNWERGYKLTLLSGWSRVDIWRSFFSFSFTRRDPVLTCDSMWSMSRDSFSSFCFTSSRTWGLSEVRFCQSKLELSIQCSCCLVLVNLTNSVHHDKCTCIGLIDTILRLMILKLRLNTRTCTYNVSIILAAYNFKINQTFSFQFQQLFLVSTHKLNSIYTWFICIIYIINSIKYLSDMRICVISIFSSPKF